MLKRFSVENFLSFKDEQILDLTASQTTVLDEHVIKFKEVNLLRSSVIYGANASGKSNFIKAVDFFRKVVLHSILDVDTNQKHFRLSQGYVDKDTTFELEVELGGKFYAYGFSCSLKKKIISSEWLYQISKKGSKCIFQREQSEIELGDAFTSSAKIKNRFEIYAEDMQNQSSQLFLTEIATKDLSIESAELMNALYKWFKEKLIIIYPSDKFVGINSSDENLTKNFARFLQAFDTGVKNVISIEKDFHSVFKNMPEEIKADIEKDLAIEKDIKILLANDSQHFTVYKNENSEIRVTQLGLIHGNDTDEVFELKDESDGTRRLLDFIPLINKFDQSCTVFIDEFDRSFHPSLTKAYFNLFFNAKNTHSQLIVTTHESTLLDLELLRRDEIWFVDKENSVNSNLFTLNKFNVRYDKKVNKAYLLGRYGAVPVIANLG